jgi:hypothetical protein
VQKAILDSFPKTEISVSIVWIEMLPGDNLAAAQKMAGTIRDSRVRHFFDPRATRRAGNAIAKGLLNDGAGPAWDIYLFYDREAEWKDDPPKPADWMHQLGGGQRADPARFHIGEKLVVELRRSFERMMQPNDKSKGK